MFPNGNSYGSTSPATTTLPHGITTGSWYGLGNTWGSVILSASLDQSFAKGDWKGIDYSYGTYLIPSESYDRFNVIDDEHPYVNQSIAPGLWDPFPIPSPPPEPVLPPRDMTRYRKTYSSQRHQVQRIRIVRNR